MPPFRPIRPLPRLAPHRAAMRTAAMRGGLTSLLLVVATACDNAASQSASASVPTPAPRRSAAVVAVSRVEPRDGRVLTIAAPELGRVVRLWVAAGDTVRAGDVILELDAERERARLDEADAAVGEAAADLVVSQAAVAAAAPRLAYARAQLVRLTALHQARGSSTEELQGGETEVTERALALARQQAEVDAAVWAHARARAAQQTALVALERRTVHAPVAGVVLAVDVALGAVVGSGDAAQTTLVQIAPLGPLEVTAEIDELLAADVTVGQQAIVAVPGGPTSRARVTRVAPGLRQKSLLDAGDGAEDRRVREIHLVLPGDARLLVGSRVDVRLDLDRSRD